ncbi:hypothetical protein M501DRAFT_1015126 [Patellaria atrata CBS 101060]|uniref:Rab-GAP TBC domain-containing protein n=1 Tax=Patellaria atrata CBS 101060 TaxID=1346257 RepID=A0A9P4VQN3_9PEZI|nr:hypothetical protein M501DRAFT_1015126 [Patellaria atrata CBS 101060]
MAAPAVESLASSQPTLETSTPSRASISIEAPLESPMTPKVSAHIENRSPRTHVDSQPLPTDSMVSVTLSDHLSDPVEAEEEQSTTLPFTHTRVRPEITVQTHMRRVSSYDILRGAAVNTNSDPNIGAEGSDTVAIGVVENEEGHTEQLVGDRSRSNSDGSSTSEKVDWKELEKEEEEQESKDEIGDESMALLLARLEQENQAIATDPKSALRSRARGQSRPPSLNKLKKLVAGNYAPAFRFSQLPSPPPMTELEFWAALVRDYPQTIQRLPTLTLNKIRGGIPAPLRGVTWISMAGARNKVIESEYDRLCGESSPYENLIGKDIGRSFPGVEMFRDPEGEGQKMMGRVLKCFSLYDNKIGYCQGLGFLVGPLLMQMGDREAFCVLVRLMEDYDLRSSFLPDLCGLHLRIYQFQKLLHQHMPKLAAHLDEVGVEGAYLSQWFLSFFATTCPLPMLFRIYDVIFAEGASETMMRVGLSIMRRNEGKILAFSEYEDVMQLLLSRALWDPYGRNAKSADEFVNDFVSFTNIVTRETLRSLEVGFKEDQKNDPASKAGFFPDVQTAAARFLGRLWAPSPSNASTRYGALSPGLTSSSHPVSFLRRTASKQSLASTLNSLEVSTDASTNSTVLTDPSSISRDFSVETLSLKSQSSSVSASIKMSSSRANVEDSNQDATVRDLLNALREVEGALREAERKLRKSEEDQGEDHKIMKQLIQQLQYDFRNPQSSNDIRRTTWPVRSVQNGSTVQNSPVPSSKTQRLLYAVETRLSSPSCTDSFTSETKAELKGALENTRVQLDGERKHSADLGTQLLEMSRQAEQDKTELREARKRLQDGHRERQRLERQIQDLRATVRRGSSQSSSYNSPPLNLTLLANQQTRPPLVSSQSSDSSPQRPPKRTSSLAAQELFSTENHEPMENDALLLELVNAKNEESRLKQELEEYKGRYEALVKGKTLQEYSEGFPALEKRKMAGNGAGSWSFWGKKNTTP